jgi:hypothetical protein
VLVASHFLRICTPKCTSTKKTQNLPAQKGPMLRAFLALAAIVLFNNGIYQCANFKVHCLNFVIIKRRKPIQTILLSHRFCDALQKFEHSM